MSGILPNGKETPRDALRARKPKETFQKGLASLNHRFSELKDAARVAQHEFETLCDIRPYLLKALMKRQISHNDFSVACSTHLSEFIHSMPLSSADLHLHIQWAKNSSLRAKLTDLNDWVYLGVAAMYCDLLFTEKQFRDLITRDGFEPMAKVVTDWTEFISAISQL